MAEIRFSYNDAPTIRKFAQCDKFIRGLMGPFGSGKSSGCVVEIIRRSHQQPPAPDGTRYTRWAVIRNTYPQLRDTTIKTFHSWLPPHIFGQWNKSEHVYTIDKFPGCNIEVLFRALDRPEHISNLLSLELTGAWVNEAREVPLTIINALQGRVGRYPAAKDGGASWFGIFMDTNPPDTDSWWYRLFEERRPDNAELFRQPSGTAPDAENIKNLPRGYYENLLSSMDEESARVYVHGDYGFIRDGKPIFNEYSDSLHCRECEPVSGLPVYRGWDFGLTPACSFSQFLPNGQWVNFDEMVSESMGIDRFSDEVLQHCSREYSDFRFVDIGDPAGQQRAQTDERTCYDIMMSKGIDVYPGIQTLQIRLESVKFALRNLVDGKPVYVVSPKCRTLRKGMQGQYKFRRLQTSEERYGDAPDKNAYSHINDAHQYVATILFGHLLTTPKHADEYDEDNRWNEHGRSAIGGY